MEKLYIKIESKQQPPSSPTVGIVAIFLNSEYTMQLQSKSF